MSEMLPYTPTGEELAEVGQVLDLSAYTLDPLKEWEPLQYAFSKDGIGLAPRGDIQVVKAPQKNGKTFLLTLMMGAVLRGEYLGLKCEIEDARALFIDTEQHPRNTQLVYRRVCHIAGLDGHQYNDRIKMLHMRGAQVEMIRKAILQEIVFWKPDVVFIDGVVDCVVDPNDQAESKAYITELSAIAMRHNCSIWSVLHVNPGSDKMRGHLGTIMSQKVSDVLSCVKKKQPDGSIVFEVEQTDTRNKDVTKLTFVIENRQTSNNEFIAVPIAPYVSDSEKAKLNDMMQEIFCTGPMTPRELYEAVKEKFGVKRARCYEIVRDAKDNGIIDYDQLVTNKYRYVGILKTSDEAPF